MNDAEINHHQLHIFHAVARHLSYSRAAQELLISQPAVSRQVAALERSLGVALFERQGRQIALSDAGRLVYDYAEQALALSGDLRRSLAELQGLERGRLRLAATDVIASYVLPPIVVLYRRRHPGVALSLQVASEPGVVQSLLSNDCDLGLIEGPPSAPNLQWQPFAEDELVLIAPAADPQARRHPFDAAGIAEATLILPEAGSPDRSFIESGLERLGVRPGASVEMGHTEAVKAAVRAGVGLGFVSRLALSEAPPGSGLAVIELPGLELQRQLGLITPKGRRLPRAALAFVALLHKAYPA